MLVNDTDIDSADTLSVVAGDSTSAEGVTVTNNSDGTFRYTPPIDFTGPDTFNYTVTDSNGCTNEGTFTVTVNADSTTTDDDSDDDDSTTNDDDTDTTDDSTSTDDDSDSGGGSLSIWNLFFLGLPLLMRRFRKR